MYHFLPVQLVKSYLIFMYILKIRFITFVVEHPIRERERVE